MEKNIKIFTKTVAVFLSLTLFIGLLPMNVFAQEVKEYLARNSISTEEEIKEARIISEIVSKRDSNTKVFLRADGSETAVISGAPLHFKDDKKWVDIDNTLKEKTVDGKSVLQNKAGAFTVSIPSDLSDNNTVSIENEGYKLSFGLQSEELENKIGSINAQVQQPRELAEAQEEQRSKADSEVKSDAYKAAGLDTLQSAVLFENIEDNTDLQYVVSPNGLKENIILNSTPKKSVSYTYAVTAEELSAFLCADKSIDFKDKSGAVIFTMPAPFMYDINREKSYDIVVSLSGNAGLYTITYMPSFTWLSDMAREYPITLDPVVMFGHSGAIDDAYVDSANPNSNYGNAYTGQVKNINDEVKEAYFKMAAISVFNKVKITKATLALFLAGYGTFGVHSILNPWEESGTSGVTYNTKPSLSSEYLDYVVFENNTQNTTGHYFSFDVTSHYCNMQVNDTGSSDNGIAITADGTGDSCLEMMFSEAGSYGGANLIISYVPVNYMDGVIDSHSFSIGRAGALYVNDFSRDAFIVRNDISVEGNILPVDISFNYNSNGYKAINGPGYEGYCNNSYGIGWLSSYNRFLDLSFADGSIVGYCNEYGDISGFVYDEEASTTELIVYEQVNESNIYPDIGTLYDDTINEKVYIEASNGETWYFDNYLRLNEIKDKNDNSVLIEYVNTESEESYEAISKITDAVGREYRFSYNESGYLGAIAVYDKYGDPVTVDGANGAVPLKYEYAYGDVGELLTVTYPDLAETAYGYDNEVEGRIVKAQGIDGYNFGLAYNDAGNVTTVREKKNTTTTGNILSITGDTAYQNTFTYRYGSTNNTPYKQEIKQFDKYGRTLSVRNEDDEFVGAVYSLEEIDGEEYSFLDSITEEISIFGTTENLLTNGDFATINDGDATGWNETNLTTEDIGMSGSGTGSHTTNVFRVKGSPAAAKSILQAVTPQTTLEKGDILTLGGWMKASPIVSSGTDGRFCGLKLTYTYTQTGVNGQQFNTPVEKTIPFSHTNGAWVFDAAEFTVEGPVVDNQVTVSAVYANQQNTAYFADIQLTLTETEEEEIASPCACANCAYGSYCPCECTENCDCPECKACTCPGCSHSQGEPCNCSQPTLCTCAQCRVCVCGENCAYGKGCTCTCTANCNCPQCAKCECVNCDHAIGEACNCTDSENCTCAQCAVCVCGENCAYGKGCSCTCASAEACTCTQCHTPSKCICDGCEESDCSCRCTSEAACACLQCKRRSINTTDGNGNILTSGSFDGTKTLQTHNTYTADGNYINSSCDSTGNMVQFSYNRENGNLNAITDGEGNTVSYTYNAMRALVGVSQLVSNLSNGTSISNTYNYSNDRLTSITHNGFSYNFTYDTTWGTPTGVKVGSQNLVTYAYGTGENRERLGTITYGNGDTVTYSYDDDDNVTGISYDNGTTYAYLYTYTDGELTSITDNQSGYVTSYTDNSVEVKQGSTTLFKTGNDGEDNYTETSNGATYTYTYGDSDYTQSTGISESTSGISFGTSGINFASSSDWFGRDLSNTMTAVGSSGNLGSVGHSFTYKGNATTTTEQVDTYTSTVTPTSGTATDTEYSYTYDNNGNIRTITKDGILQYTYNYDEAGQLTRADDAVQNKSFTYTYDVGGNIVSKKEYAYTTSTLGSVVDTISYTYDGTWKDKLVSYDGNSITYDAIGNPLTYSGYTFEWNGRILNSITGNSKTLNFKYNENGLRTEKKVTQNSITTTYNYIWNGEKLVSQSDGTNTFYFFYNDSKYAPDGFVLNGTDNYLYTKNLQGDITGIADSNGSIVTTYTYDAWGKIISVTGSQSTTIGTANPFRYRGYYYDTETELYYLQSRYYNPEWDRFLNADSTDYLGYGGFVSYNLFAYCENNPVSYFDYYGSFKGVYHYESTRDIAKKYFDKQYAKIIAEYAKKVDSLYPPINIYSEYCQSFHFNTNIGTKKEDSRIIRSEEFFFKAVEYLKEAAQIKKEGLSNAWKTYKFNNAIKNAFKYFGISIHPIQDLYAHSGSKGQKTGYIYINKYSNQQYISYSKMVVGSNIMQIGVFCHHCNNGNFDADDPSGKYLNTGRTKAFYSEAVTEIYMIAFAHYAEQYYKYVLLKY